MTAYGLISIVGVFLVLFVSVFGVLMQDMYARQSKKQLEVATRRRKVPDYKRIAELERECEVPIENVARRAAAVAENYWHNPGLLYRNHPHIRDHGWPRPISFDWSLCHCPPETRTVVERRTSTSRPERYFTCGDCGKPLT